MIQILAIFFSATFSGVALPVRGLLHLRFLLRAGDAAKFEKLASLMQAKHRWCSCSLKLSHAHYLLPSYTVQYLNFLTNLLNSK